jgi:DtxR family Mn-dependent transcriptional regulator
VSDPAATRPPRDAASRSLRAETIDHYLETIYYIHHEREPVRPSRIAEWMSVSAATVSTTLRSLERDGWIRVAPDRSATLTAKGRRRAELIVRAHRLAERWLTDRLGLDWASADDEAQRLAQALSPRVIDRLDEHLDQPATCPHGNVIPGRRPPYGSLVSLADLEPDTPALVRRISEVAEHDAPDLLRLLDASDVVTGNRVEVVGARSAADAVAVKVGRRTIALGTDVARSIWVEPERPARGSRRRS